MHTPPLQTLPAPHAVPFGASPLCVQTGMPVEHDVTPVVQGFPGDGLHVAPATHITHAPATQD